MYLTGRKNPCDYSTNLSVAAIKTYRSSLCNGCKPLLASSCYLLAVKVNICSCFCVPVVWCSVPVVWCSAH